ncbi:protein abnormal spindle [Cloeon dipterum]|uniref:protein abnormal spindle n=1 Tax=Cloeon dipterum TaxID=197152 RepID=UPI0032201774
MAQLNRISSQEDYFEISPVHKIRSGPAKLINDEKEEKAELVLKPFAAKPRLVFKGVKVGNTCSQNLLITNPDPADVYVDIVLPKCNLQTASCRFVVPAKSSVDVDLTWCPQEQGTFSESIQIKDSKGRRGTVSLSLEAIVAKPLRGPKKAAARVAVKAAPMVKSRLTKTAPTAKAKPAWHDPVPPRSPRQVLKPVPTQSIQPSWSTCKDEVPLKIDDDTPLRRETFIVCGKENDGSPALPKTAGKGDISADSLEPTPKLTKQSARRQRTFNNTPARLNDILKEFTLSPLVTNAVVAQDNSVLETQTAFATNLTSICEIETPSFDARRCSTAFKELTDNPIRKPRGVSPRELFHADMHPDVSDDRLSSATYIADRRDSNETYIADRRASNETYVAEKRLSSDTYVLSNSHSFEAASGDSTVLQNAISSPGHRTFTPVLPDVLEDITEETTQRSECVEKPIIDILPQEEISGIVLQNFLDDTISVEALPRTPVAKERDDPDPSQTFSAKKKRKFSGFDFDSIQFTPLRKDESESGRRYNLRSAGKIVTAEETQTLVAVTTDMSPPKKYKLLEETQTLAPVSIDISPPKKFKLPAPMPSEKFINETYTKKMEKVDKTYVLMPTQSGVFVPYGTKKLTLQRPAAEVPEEQDEKLDFPINNKVDDILMEFAMAKMSTPGLQEDPFFMNPLLNDAIIEKYDMDFKKWLNSVLTPPEELESSDAIQVNAAELWNRSTKSLETNLAPTKEMVSSKYLSVKSRLDQLRHAASNLFNKEAMKTVLCCVNSRVDNGKLKIRTDKALHIDQGLKHGILGLFMSYNPLWLRIGLETVCGTLIPMRNNTDVQTLSYYIISRILAPEAVVGKSHLLLNKECKEKYNKFVAKKFLMLVYFLDCAKMSKMIRHDPCLFLKNSKIKTSKEMLITFSRMVLAGEGDITKHLGYMGYKVSYDQGYLDEFNYSVKHMGVDLRDGVRITRVVELVTGSTGLSVHLRVPAISRLQKIHNVGVALKCLEDKGFTVKNLTATDIVMGHREKTLSLIWQIIHNFQVPRFNKAARVIQSWWIRPSLRTVVERRINKKKILKATIVFQKYTRGFLCRKNIAKLAAQLKEEKLQTASAVVIQRACRRFFLKRRVAAFAQHYRENEAARTIQSWIRVCQAKALLQQLRTEAAIKQAALREIAALNIQSHFRRYLAQRQLKLLRADHMKRVVAATKIQCFWRRCTAQRTTELLKEQLMQRNHAATVLQNYWRMKRAREVLGALRTARLHKLTLAACTVQRAWRCFLARKQLQLLREENEQKRNQAATLIQMAWKGFVARKTLRLLAERKQAAIVIQCAWRQQLAMRKLEFLKIQELNRKRYEASVTIQCAWRCFKSKQVLAHLLEKDLAKKNWSAIKIQCLWRSWVARKELDKLKLAHHQRREAACLVLQCAWRVLVARRILLQLKKEAAAVKIQCSWRCYEARKTLQKLKEAAALERANAAAIKIQSAWRCCLARQMLAHLVEEEQMRRNRSATVIQTAWRGKVARKQLASLKQELELKRNSAAITIQCAWRSYIAKRLLVLLMEEDRKKKYRAATVIQTAWRSKVARTLLWRLKENKRFHAASTIQCAWRCYVARKLLAHLIEENTKQRNRAATLIQTAWRGKVARAQLQHLKADWEERKNAAATHIQTTWRCFMARQELCRLRKEENDRRKRAALRIQCFWRRTLAKRTLSDLRARRVVKINKAALVIQKLWRGHATRKIIRQQQHEKQSNAALRIQMAWRSYSARNQLAHLREERFQHRTHAANTIQRSWRRFAAQRQLHSLKLHRDNSAALRIQLCWRSYLARNALKQLREEKIALTNKSATTIQCAWRCFLARRTLAQLKEDQIRRENRAAIIIQCNWRCHMAKLVLLDLKQKLEEKKNAAAIRIQCAFRCYSARKTLVMLKQQNFQKLEAAVIKIQCLVRRLRSVRLLRQLRQDRFARRTHAAVVIQKIFRGQLARRRVAQMKENIIRKQTFELQNKAALRLQTFFRMLLWRKAVATMRFVQTELLGVETELQLWRRILLSDNASLLSFKILLSVLRSQHALRMKHHISARFIQQKWRQYFNMKLSSATKIQALWRGYKCRKNIRQAATTKKAVVITDHQANQDIKLDKNVASKLVIKCDQIKEASKNVTEEQTVGYKILHALKNWQKTFDFEIGAYTLFNRCLDASEALVLPILPGIPIIVDGFQCNNRSVPAMNLAIQASEILLSVAKHPEALTHLQQIPKFIPAVLFNLHISASANEKLFLNCCTILWVLAHNHEMKQAILALPNLAFKLTSIKPKVVKAATRHAVKDMQMPSLKMHKNPRSFTNKQHAFQSVLKKLQLKL